MTGTTFDDLVSQLRGLANPVNAAGMIRFGVSGHNLLGISIAVLRPLARRVGQDHELALRLWDSQIHEARLLATMVDPPQRVTGGQMDRWAGQVDSWDTCDALCNNLFRQTPHAWPKARQWARSTKEFVRRAGFSLMASLAVHDKRADDRAFLDLLPLIERSADDDRNFVRKAVNWALRNIGKRNLALNAAAADCARRLAGRAQRSARWIGHHALRELTAPKTLERIRKQTKKKLRS